LPRTVYVPGWRLGIVYSPASLLSMLRVTRVDWLTTVTLAPGTTAPELSCTTPVMVPRSDWPKAENAKRVKTQTWRRDTRLSSGGRVYITLQRNATGVV
jgi:hypothetical protein